MTESGTTTLITKEKVLGTHNVYNLEVYREHNYSVSESGILVHNTCPKNVSLDNNALVAAVEGGQKSAVLNAIDGGRTTVSIQAAKEFLVKGDKQQLKNFMGEIGATISRNGGSTNQVQALQAQAKSLGRNLKTPDAKVAADAINNNATLITRDKKLGKFMNAAGHKAIGF